MAAWLGPREMALRGDAGGGAAATMQPVAAGSWLGRGTPRVTPRCVVVGAIAAVATVLVVGQTLAALTLTVATSHAIGDGTSVCSTPDMTGGSSAVPRVSFVASLKPMQQPVPLVPVRGHQDRDGRDGPEVPDAVWRQSNAVGSWLRAVPGATVYVVGDDSAREFAEQRAGQGVHYLGDVETTEQGVPLLDDMLTELAAVTEDGVFAFVNADIVLTPGLARVLDAACAAFGLGDPFLVIGQRFDVPLSEAIDFGVGHGGGVDVDGQASSWVDVVARLESSDSAFLNNKYYKDYFVFPRSLFQYNNEEEEGDDGSVTVPPLVVGRAGVDDWIVKAALLSGSPVIDASGAATAYHQIHTYTHVTGGVAGAWGGADAQRNKDLAAASVGNLGLLTDIDWATHAAVLSGDGHAVSIVRQPWQTFVRAIYAAGIYEPVASVWQDSSAAIVAAAVLSCVAAVVVVRRRRATGQPSTVLPTRAASGASGVSAGAGAGGAKRRVGAKDRRDE